MLKIENYNKLRYKVVGNSGWYVESVTEQMIYDPITFKTRNEQYQIMVTNRVYNKLITLYRQEQGSTKMYKLHSDSTAMYVGIDDVRDMDKFLSLIYTLLNK